MRTPGLKTLLVLLMAVSGVGNWAGAQPLLTPEQAISLALEQNYQIQIAHNQARMAENNVGLGRAEFLPTVQITGSSSLLRSNQNTNSPFSFGSSRSRGGGARVALNWTLFDGFAMFARKSQFTHLATAEQFRWRSAVESTVVEVMRAYFSVVQQERLLAVARQSLEISRRRLEKARLRDQLGGAPRIELLNAQVAFQRDTAAVLEQELALATARRNLNILLGRAPETPFQVVQEIAVAQALPGLDTLIQKAMQFSSELQAHRQSVQAARQSIALQRAVFFPRLSLNASADYQDRTVSSESPRFPEDIRTRSTDLSMSIDLSFPLFNGFRDRIALQNARIEQRNSELALQELENRIRAQVREKYQEWQIRLRLLEIEQRNVELARENLVLHQERYDLGLVSSVEFRDAQLNLVQAESAYIQARFQARLAQLELERLTGEISLFP